MLISGKIRPNYVLPNCIGLRTFWMTPVYCVASVDARRDVNVALNRPSFQISTISNDGGNYSAQYANDGSHSTNMQRGPCMQTNRETNPWWAVDLLVPLYVAGVKFTNRNNFRTHFASSVQFFSGRQHSLRADIWTATDLSAVQYFFHNSLVMRCL